MPKLSDIETQMRPYIGNCPSFVAGQQIIEAARDFFQQTRAWEEKRSVTLKANKDQLYLPFGDPEELITITVRPANGGDPLMNAGDNTLFPPGMSGAPTAFSVENSEKLVFSSAPPSDIPYLVKAQLKPGLSATTIPDGLHNQYFQAIQYYALYKLLLMPKRSWTDYQLAGEFKSNYEREVTRAKVQVRSGQSPENLRAYAEPFA